MVSQAPTGNSPKYIKRSATQTQTQKRYPSRTKGRGHSVAPRQRKRAGSQKGACRLTRLLSATRGSRFKDTLVSALRYKKAGGNGCCCNQTSEEMRRVSQCWCQYSPWADTARDTHPSSVNKSCVSSEPSNTNTLLQAPNKFNQAVRDELKAKKRARWTTHAAQHTCQPRTCRRE